MKLFAAHKIYTALFTNNGRRKDKPVGFYCLIVPPVPYAPSSECPRDTHTDIQIDRQTDRQTRLKIRALPVCNRAKNNKEKLKPNKP